MGQWNMCHRNIEYNQHFHVTGRQVVLLVVLRRSKSDVVMSSRTLRGWRNGSQTQQSVAHHQSTRPLLHMAAEKKDVPRLPLISIDLH